MALWRERDAVLEKANLCSWPFLFGFNSDFVIMIFALCRHQTKLVKTQEIALSTLFRINRFSLFTPILIGANMITFFPPGATTLLFAQY
jgi:hypothetical protein